MTARLFSVLLISLVSWTGAHDTASLADAREELESGRYWHAAQLLEELERESGGLDAEGYLLLARARAGFRDWPGVRELVEGAAWVDSVAPVEGAVLLGRALEEAGEWSGAADSYRSALARGEADPVILARLVRVEHGAGRTAEALAALEELASLTAGIGSAAAFELAEASATAGDSVAVRSLLEFVGSGLFRAASSDFHARAILEAGDSVRAEAAYRGLLAGKGTDARATGADARYREIVASLTLARGDSVAARVLFLQTLEEASRTRGGMLAAQHLVDLGGLDAAQALLAARSLDRLGDGRRALAAYDRHVALSLEAGEDPDVRARVERARLAATVPGRVEEAIEEYRALDEHPDPAVGARVLDLWAGLRRRQGESGKLRTLRRWLVERYPDTDAAAEVVFLRGDYAQDLQDWATAERHYLAVTEMAPTRALAGRARMRIGQLRLQQGDRERALSAYLDYLADFPEGRRWAEASFWAGRILLELQDTAEAEGYLDRILEEEPQSYYATLSAELLGREILDELAPDPTLPEVDWIAPLLARLDLLVEAGFEEAAAMQAEALASRADAEGPAAQYPLAEGLIARGWTIEGINRGWALVRSGEPTSRRLLGILYPFPYREMVEREAAEWGLDPILMAALIRQESAWDRDIVSPAGAVGLMQVMEPTGRQLARAIGPSGFRRQSLESAEVNLHLGGRFLKDMLDRFGPELPLVLSAYNAGPTRANRWKRFPEAGDPLRLTERIPFTETRGYVKNVTRNLGIYRVLYGAPTGVADSP